MTRTICKKRKSRNNQIYIYNTFQSMLMYTKLNWFTTSVIWMIFKKNSKKLKYQYRKEKGLSPLKRYKETNTRQLSYFILRLATLQKLICCRIATSAESVCCRSRQYGYRVGVMQNWSAAEVDVLQTLLRRLQKFLWCRSWCAADVAVLQKLVWGADVDELQKLVWCRIGVLQKLMRCRCCWDACRSWWAADIAVLQKLVWCRIGVLQKLMETKHAALKENNEY